MADNKSRESRESTKRVGQLTYELSLDCAEALTGLKAIQREAKKATQALRELEEAQNKTVNVESEVDVRKIAEHLNDLARKEQRGRGIE